MDKSELIDKFSNILSVRQGTAEDLVDGLISAVKEECCSGELKWEPIPGWIDPISIKPSESNQSWHRQMFDMFVAGISKKGCAECVSDHFSKSEPGCLKPGCRRERWINVKPPEPQLIQGYTAEQWAEIVDGGYLCEFSSEDSFEPHNSRICNLLGHEPDRDSFVFYSGSQGSWSFCRPAQIKGVMRPIFMEPVDKNEMICLFTAGGFPLNNIRSRMSYAAYLRREETEYSDATKYIEL